MPDWTWGCIAVSNTEMDEVYSMVQLGTKIFIYA
jgi:lipoprotein-anchoring transpeptidase ErfK/SrfK